MDWFAYHLAWAILAIQATLVLLIVMYIVGRVVGFAQVLWQKYVWSKIKTAYGRSHHTADRDAQNRTRRIVQTDKSLVLHEDIYFERLHKGPGAIPPSNPPNLNGVLRQ